MSYDERENLRTHFEAAYAEFSDDDGIPDHMKAALDSYVYDRVQPGGFLTAVLENDFKNAVSRADATNARYFKQYGYYVNNCIPSNSHGSAMLVMEWLKGSW